MSSLTDRTSADRARRRVAAWRAAVARLIAEHRAEFSRLYTEEKIKRGL